MERVRAFVKYTKQRRAVTTARVYQRAAENFEGFCESEDIVTLEGQKPGMLDDFVGYLVDKRLAPATVRSIVAGARAYLDFRERQGEVFPHFLNPKLPKVVKKEPFALETGDLINYWRICATHPDPGRTIMTLLPLCGLRSQEIVSIMLEDGVSVKEGWIILHVIGKGGKPRSVPLLPQGNQILGQYLHGWRIHNKQDNRFLFPGYGKGRHFQTRTLRRQMKDVCDELDLEGNLTPHVLRKTYLTFLDHAGVSSFAIAKLAGHSSPRTTHESYIHQNIESLISKLGDVEMPQPEPDDEE